MTTATLSLTTAADQAFDRFGTPLPRELREEASAMSWEHFVADYAPASGPVRLGHWECTDAHRKSSRMGPQPRNFRATIAVGDRIDTSTAVASGPVAALTAMLHDHGHAVEMLSFHQLETCGQTATFVKGSDGARQVWAMGSDTDSTQSALRAVVACANRLAAAANSAPTAAV